MILDKSKHQLRKHRRMLEEFGDRLGNPEVVKRVGEAIECPADAPAPYTEIDAEPDEEST